MAALCQVDQRLVHERRDALCGLLSDRASRTGLICTKIAAIYLLVLGCQEGIGRLRQLLPQEGECHFNPGCFLLRV